MKRILILSYEFPPLGGGTANALYYLLKEYSKHATLKIDLVTSSTGKFKKERFSKQISIYRLNIGKNKKNLYYQSYKDLLIYSIKALFFSWKLRLKNKYDLVHSFYGIPPAFVAMLLFKPYIVSLRGSDVPFYNRRFRWLDRFVFVYLNKLVWGRARCVVANSSDLKALALKTTPNLDIKIIPNGVDTEYFKPDRRVKKEKAILFVGRLIKRKRADWLLKAFCKLPSKLKKSWEVWIVGEGPEKINLQKLAIELGIKDNVKFWGRLNKKRLRKIYQKSRIFVLPSYNEGMSNSLLEAMATGLPVIAADTGGVNNFIGKNMIIKNKRELLKTLKLLINKKITSGKPRTQVVSWRLVSEKYIRLM